MVAVAGSADEKNAAGEGDDDDDDDRTESASLSVSGESGLEAGVGHLLPLVLLLSSKHTLLLAPLPLPLLLLLLLRALLARRDDEAVPPINSSAGKNGWWVKHP